MYLRVDPAGSSPTITVDTTGTDFDRAWDIGITRIACDSADLG